MTYFISVPVDQYDDFSSVYEALTGEVFKGRFNKDRTHRMAGSGRVTDNHKMVLERLDFNIFLSSNPPTGWVYAFDEPIYSGPHSGLPDALENEGEYAYVSPGNIFLLIREGYYQALNGKWSFVQKNA